MKTPIKYLLLFWLLSACETVVDFDVPRNPPRLVLNAVLVDGEFIRAHLSASRYILDEEPFVRVEGAEVAVYANDTLLAILPDSLDGKYISATHRAARGVNYRFEVSKEGYTPLIARVTLPADTARVVAVTLDTVEQVDYGYAETYLRFSIEIDDSPGEENYYQVEVLRKGYNYIFDYSTDPPTLADSVLTYTNLSLETRDPGVEDYLSYGHQLYLNDDLFDGQRYVFRVLAYPDSAPPEMADDTPDFKVVVSHTSRSYYLYMVSVRLQQWQYGNPFAQPVQVYSNVEGGYGLLGAYNRSVMPVSR